MIELTRLNGQKLFVNCDLLKYAKASPDTVLTLLTGDKLVVRESCEEVMTLALTLPRARFGGGVAGRGCRTRRTDSAVRTQPFAQRHPAVNARRYRG